MGIWSVVEKKCRTSDCGLLWEQGGMWDGLNTPYRVAIRPTGWLSDPQGGYQTHRVVIRPVGGYQTYRVAIRPVGDYQID